MRLKVSFCNKTVLKTDIVRYAPLWGGYTLMLALLTLMCIRAPGESPEYAYAEMVRLFSARAGHMVFINGFYALAVVQALWGDLLTPRLCNSLHAMPVTRDGFFGAHLVSGVLFAIVPNVLVYSLAALMVPGEIAAAPLMTLAAACLQYLFYLGAALVAVQLAGNRMGMVLAYGMLNFFSILVYWFCAQVFTPLTYGTEANVNWMANICPTVVMYRGSYFTPLEHYLDTPTASIYYYDGMERGRLWVPAMACALVGVGLIALAQFLYRRRKLESAGDLLAYPGLAPVFLVMNTLMVAAFIHLGVSLMDFEAVSQYFFLPLGLIVGYVSGLMLLRRTTRVFRKRLLLPLAGILVLCALTVCGIYTDVFKVIRRVPQENQVMSVTVEPVNGNYGRKPLEVTDREKIQAILSYHRESLNGWQDQVRDALLQKTSCWKPGAYFNVRLEYKLENGRTMARRYALRRDFYSSPEFMKVMSAPELSLGCTEAELREKIDRAEYVMYGMYAQDEDGSYRTVDFEDRDGLCDAMMMDSREGTLLNYSFWDETYGTSQSVENLGDLSIQGGREDDYYYIWFPINENTAHTLRWLVTHEGEYMDAKG
ncbi:MAG: hypothetical protein J6B70_05180 [Oscillospiraceae bacterium]|nr:hypothetical protein [Oscillospiraceae bacterium]